MEPIASDAYLIASEIERMVGESKLKDLAFDHGSRLVSRLEQELEHRITPQGKKLIERHDIKHPLKEILQSLESFNRMSEAHKELTTIYGPTSQSKKVREQFQYNSRPLPIGWW